MGQIDLELAQTCLADRAFGGDIHILAGFVNRAEIGVKGIELSHRQDRMTL